MFFQKLIDSAINLITILNITIVVDILIVAYVVYKLIKMIEETRAMQLLKGIVMLFLALGVSELLGLNVIYFLIRNTVQTGVLALIIVFQPELRRALERMGRSRLGNVFNVDVEAQNRETKRMLSEVTKAVDLLSIKKIGALLVFELDTKLRDVIDTGTIIDARVSSALIINTFYPNTPLHDGAVIIGNNVVKAAGCFLPLSTNQDISKELGTRHRAALGMSEVSDAIVVVVSEETGKISITHKGNLTRNLSVETLKKALEKYLVIKEEKQKRGIIGIIKGKEK